MRIEVDEEACTGHGRCYVLCPQVFEEDESGYCRIPNAVVPPTIEDTARHAAEACPERAIRVIDS
jgi:ferredoxin